VDFFFPDSQDQVDPGFDFRTEQWSPLRVRQRDDLYAHEIHDAPPYDGMLISKTIVDGLGGAGRYTAAQRHRLFRLGVHDFFRLNRPDTQLMALGDCGAFSYVRHEDPPYSVDEVLDFYENCGVDLGISVDHVILGYDADADFNDEEDPEWSRRQQLTLRLASEFLKRHSERGCSFVPLGVAQGWSPGSYAYAVDRLQELGYTRIALGGLVPLKTDQILACLAAIDAVRHESTKLHLLGVTRTDEVQRFTGHGVTSFDSTTPLRQAFKDDKDNYYTLDRHYVAVRVPAVEGNAKLAARIRAGQLDQREAQRLERRALDSLDAYDRGRASSTKAVNAVIAYERFLDNGKDRADDYRETLDAAPWKSCPCPICGKAKVHVALFRGTERNKRRGFHNLFVFNCMLQGRLVASGLAMEGAS
jgi:hypothetical protein